MILGIDTSNYTTSVALYDEENNIAYNFKKLLPVKSGEKGLRQSDAVFHHTMQIRELLKKAFKITTDISSVGVSISPCDNDGSYMPCFMVGQTVAEAISGALNAKLFTFSHQRGHVAAALYSCNKLNLIDQRFIAFHFSGGTSDAIIVEPDKEKIIKCNVIASSSDLKAGQSIDRAGVMLGLPFPCGKYIDELASKSNAEFKIKPSFSGLNPSFSGVENKCIKMHNEGAVKEDIAKYAVSYTLSVVDNMTEMILKEYGRLPLVYAGGVMSNSIIRKCMIEKYECSFAKPEFSSDNAVGIAVLAALKEKQI
ncbi:MAG: peptidase M22 [Clostridia bacterium]|nr:peptidase M22 [Clostridia bacterium]